MSVADADIGRADPASCSRGLRHCMRDPTITCSAAADLADKNSLVSRFIDPVHISFSDAGIQTRNFPREEFIAFAVEGPDGRDCRPHPLGRVRDQRGGFISRQSINCDGALIRL